MDKICNYFKRFVLLMTMISLGIITYFSLFTMNETAQYLRTSIRYPQYLLGMSALLLGAFVILMFQYIDKWDEKKLTRLSIGCLFILIVGQIVMMFCFDVVQITDSFLVRDQALAIVQGIDKHIDYESIWYFKRYGNNNFYLLLTVWLYRLFEVLHIQNTSLAFVIFNTTLIDLAVWMTYKLAVLLRDKRFAGKVLLLCVMNPLNYLLLYWTYTCTYSIVIGVTILYLAVLIYKQNVTILKKVCFGGGIGGLLVIGYFLRPTALIPFIAVICCFVMYQKKDRESRRQYVYIVICMFIVAAGCFIGIKKGNARYAVEDKDNFPATHWVMMGLHEGGEVNTHDNALTASYKTKEEKAKANLKEIYRTAKEYGISGLTDHFIEKLAGTWADGTADYGDRIRPDRKISRMYQWVGGEKTDLVVMYCQSYRIVLMLFAFFSVCTQRERTRREEKKMFVISLTVLGGILFYLLWEGKSSYSVPFLPFLCILAVDGAEFRRKVTIKRETLLKTAQILILITIVTGVANYWTFSKVKETWNHYRIYSDNVVAMQWQEEISQKDQVVTQDFFVSGGFNRLRIFCKKNEDYHCQYKVQLRKDGRIVNEFLVDETNIEVFDEENSFITLKTSEQKVQRRQQYQIRIEPVTAGAQDSVRWGSRYSKVTDIYDGACIVDGEKQVTDLYLRVYEEKEGVYMSPILYIGLFMITIALEIWLLWSLYHLNTGKEEICL